MSLEWNLFPSELQVAVSREALKRARLVVAAQAKLLAEQMELGALPSFDGPDALRLLVMILSENLADAPTEFDHDPAATMPLPMADMASNFGLTKS